MWNSTTSLNNSNIYENGVKIGIGTTTSQNALNVIGDINATSWIYSNGVNLSALNSTGLIINWSSVNGAQYNFGSNNFNGSGYFNTSGIINGSTVYSGGYNLTTAYLYNSTGLIANWTQIINSTGLIINWSSSNGAHISIWFKQF